MTEPQNPAEPDPYATPTPGPEQGSSPYGMPQYPPSQYGQPPYGGQPYPPLPQSGYASWLQRVGAYLIDGLLTGVPTIVLVLLGSAIGGGVGVLFLLLGYLAGLSIFIWNTVLRQGRTGQSIGKAQVSVRLIRETDGQPVGPGMAFVRQLAHIIDGIPCYIGYLWPLWDKKRQTFADKICGTVVVRT
jgi:uncharacterized RDD family membrane protein YckC